MAELQAAAAGRALSCHRHVHALRRESIGKACNEVLDIP